MKHKLNGWTKVLEQEWKRWCKEKVAAAEKEAAFEKAVAEAARKLLEVKGLSYKLIEALKAHAEGMLDEGAAGEDPPLPKGFGEKPKPKLEAKAEEKKAEAEDKKGEEEAEAEDKNEEDAAVEEKKAEAEGKKDEEEAEAEDKNEKNAAVKEKKALSYYLSLEESLAVEIAKTEFTVEDLLAEDRQKYLRVRDFGQGVCSKCKWTSGCLRCFEPKAWDYYVRQALGFKGSKAKAKPKKK